MKKVRLGFIALAVMVSVATAFATKTTHIAGSNIYGVLSEDGTYYYVSLSSGSCTGTTGDCKISTNDTPDPDNMDAVLKTDATVTAHGTFH